MARQATPRARVEACGAVTIEIDVAIAADADRVWRALVDETGKWWHRDFYTSPLARGFRIEAKIGGRMYEDWGGSSGAVWGTVVVFDEGRVLEFAGHLTPSFGGPATTMVRIELLPGERGCTLRLRDGVFGRVDEGTAASLENGWRMLFGDEGLKGYVEKGERKVRDR
ncbi:MAG: SRPBCC domain-containing protein [Phycisphaeraceae bacterium]|nr:SRPBCC domain-containing protein [Phycisphaeraceae bacterium]